MKRGVLEEQVHYQTAVDFRIYSVSGAYDFLKGIVVCYDYKCAGLVFRHVSACFRDLIDRLIGMVASGLSSENAVYDFSSCCVGLESVSELDQEFSDFGLEDDYEREYSDVKHSLHYGGHELHVE